MYLFFSINHDKGFTKISVTKIFFYDLNYRIWKALMTYAILTGFHRKSLDVNLGLKVSA